jgi:hypothetical protein
LMCLRRCLLPALVGLALEMEMAIQGLGLGCNDVQVDRSWRRNRMIAIKIYHAIPFDCVRLQPSRYH